MSLCVWPGATPSIPSLQRPLLPRDAVRRLLCLKRPLRRPPPALTLARDRQTGSGKSYSMVGNPDDHGIVPRVASELFDYINSRKDDNIAFEVVTSMIEIYKEQIRDLLTQKQGRPGSTEELKVREHPKSGPYVAGLTALTANSYKEIERQLELGNRNKSVASTHMNDVSSRAHTIFQIKFSQTRLEHLGGETGLAREVGLGFRV